VSSPRKSQNTISPKSTKTCFFLIFINGFWQFSPLKQGQKWNAIPSSDSSWKGASSHDKHDLGFEKNWILNMYTLLMNRPILGRLIIPKSRIARYSGTAYSIDNFLLYNTSNTEYPAFLIRPTHWGTSIFLNTPKREFTSGLW
jgi:hypothetical protein